MSAVSGRTLNEVTRQATVAQPPPLDQSVMQKTVEVDREEPARPQDIAKKIVFYMAITSFFLMWAVFYIFFQALNPWIVQKGDLCYKDACEKGPVDNGKCLVAGLILAVVFFIVIYLIISAF